MNDESRYQHLTHTFDPVYTENSKILILGSFPSVKSREEGFFYGHPRNRFWSVISRIFECEKPMSIPEKKAFLLKNDIALWDTIHSCDIIGSSDSSIKNVVPNDIADIVQKSHIQRIFTNGKKADELYKKYIEQTVGMSAECLPSTSPANAVWTLEKLCEEWKKRLLN